MKALIVTGGEFPPSWLAIRLAREADIVIAADSGLDAANDAGIEPDLVVGDFDSLKDQATLAAIPHDRVIEYPTDKDDTDTEIALGAAHAKGADYIVVAGGGGGRLDHLLAMISLFAREEPPREWHTAMESVYFLRREETARFAVPLDATISVFPAGCEESRGMKSSGLRWPLEGLIWNAGHFGISNRSLEKNVRISAGSSDLLVVVPLGCECLFEQVETL